MTTISRDQVQIEFTAIDRTRRALTTINRGITRTLNRSRELLRSFAALSGRAVLRGITSLTRGFTSLAASIAKIGVGAVLGGVTALTAQGIRANAELERYALALGGTNQQLQGIVALSNASQEDTLELLKNLRERVGEAAAEEGGIRDAFNSLGIDTSELQQLSGSDIETIFFRFSDAIKNADDQSVALFRSMEVLGEEGFKAFSTLAQGADQLRSRLPFLEQLGLIVPEETTERIRRLTTSLNLARRVLGSLAQEVAGRVSPIIEGFVTNFVAFVAANGGIGTLVSNTFDLVVEKAREVGRFLQGLFERLRDIGGETARLLGLSDRPIEEIPDRLVEINRIIKNTREEIERLQKNPGLFDSLIGPDVGLRLENETLERFIAERTELVERWQAFKDGAEQEAEEPTTIFDFFSDGLEDNDTTRDLRARIEEQTSLVTDSLAQLQNIPRPTLNIGNADGSGVSTVITEKDLDTFRNRVADLRTGFSELETITRNFDRSVAEVNLIPDTAFDGEGDRQAIIDGLTRTRDAAIAEFNQRVADVSFDSQRFEILGGINLDAVTDLPDTLRQIALSTRQEAAQITEALTLGGIDAPTAEDSTGRLQEFASNLRLQAEQSFQETRASLRSEALDFSDFVNFDVSGVTSATAAQSAEELNQLFRERVKQVNLLSEEVISGQEKANAVQEISDLVAELNERAKVSISVSTVREGLGAAGNIGDAINSLQSIGADRDTQALEERSTRIQSIQEQLNAALEAGNEEQVRGLQNKLAIEQQLFAKEEQEARKRFERNKRIQIATGLINTAAAALGVFADTNGGLFTRIAAAAAATAAGLATVAGIASQQFQGGGSTANGFGAGATAAGGGNNITNNDVRTDTAQAPAQRNTTVVNINARRGQPFSFEFMEDLAQQINEHADDGGTEIRITGT